MTRTVGVYAEYPFEDYWYIVVSCKICFTVHLVRHPKDAPFDSHKNIVLWPQPDSEVNVAIPEARCALNI
jgi:hypothetical protein